MEHFTIGKVHVHDTGYSTFSIEPPLDDKLTEVVQETLDTTFERVNIFSDERRTVISHITGVQPKRVAQNLAATILRAHGHSTESFEITQQIAEQWRQASNLWGG
jgi:hypothetical protein